MNRLNTFILSAFAVLATLVLGFGTAVAASYLKVDIAAPDGEINRRTFNVEFTTLSTDADNNIDVRLYQNGSVIKSTTTTKDYGDSGAFSVSVPADGTYEYYFTASTGTETASSSKKTVKVDSVATSAASYGGVTRIGNTYTVTFTAPASGDVVQIRLYSSPSPTFTADASTQVGVVSVAPGQTASITYTAPDDRQRYHAIQAFDNAGNGSILRGDSDTRVTQGLGTASQDGQAADTGVAGAETGGQVDAEGDSTDVNSNAADVLSDGSEKSKNVGVKSGDSWAAWAIVIVLVAASLGYANRQKLVAAYKKIRPGSNS